MEDNVYVRIATVESKPPRIWWEADDTGGVVNIRLGDAVMCLPMGYIQAHQEEFDKLADFVCSKPEEVNNEARQA